MRRREGGTATDRLDRRATAGRRDRGSAAARRDRMTAGPVAIVIRNKRGLHARASARFVTCAHGFDAAVTVTRDGASVAGTSIMGLMMLAAAPGDTIEIAAEGNEADAALAALVALVEGKFGED